MTNRKEREANKRAFKKMSPQEKAAYIFAYYKLPIFTGTVVLAVLISTIVHNITKKDPVLYVAYENIAVGETLDTKLTSGYIEYTEKNPKKQEVLVYADLYISDDPSFQDHQFAYASKMKVLGAVSAKQLDIVIMNQEAYDQMSASGFLVNLDAMKEYAPDFYAETKPYLQKNTVIISDNAVEYSLNEADTYEAETEEITNGVNASDFPVFRNAGVDGDVLIGIIANTTHLDEGLNYILYLLDGAE